MTVPVNDPFQDLDAVLAQLIRTEEERSPWRGAEAVAVAAIVALSHAGRELVVEASFGGLRAIEKFNRGRTQMARARELIMQLIEARDLS